MLSMIVQAYKSTKRCSRSPFSNLRLVRDSAYDQLSSTFKSSYEWLIPNMSDGTNLEPDQMAAL